MNADEAVPGVHDMQEIESAKIEAIPSAPHVYTAIADVMGELAQTGIAKGRKNQQQGFQFRGIDDVYNALAPMLSRHRLVMLPDVLDRSTVDRQTKNGGSLFYVTLRVQYTLVSAVDGSSHTVTVDGEAMDSADKATNKAMSAAFKYMCLQVFCIPTEAQHNDADEVTHPETVASLSQDQIERLNAALAELDEVKPGAKEQWIKPQVDKYGMADTTVGIALPPAFVDGALRNIASWTKKARDASAEAAA